MEEKLRSYFFTGNFQNFSKHQGKKDDYTSLLQARSQVLMEKDPGMNLPNLKILDEYHRTNKPSQPQSDVFEETLNLIFGFNADQESIIIDSIKPDTLEKKLIMACSLLKIRRNDAAESLIKNALTQHEDEGALTLLLAYCFYLKNENDECASLTNELISKYGESPILLNLQALCFVQENNFLRAEAQLVKALQLSKEFSVKQFKEFTLRNLISCKRLMGENYSEYEQELLSLNCENEYFQIYKAASDLFDQSLG